MSLCTRSRAVSDLWHLLFAMRRFAIRKLAPSYINDLVKIKPLNSRYGLRSNDGILLSHPNFKTLTTLGDRAFVASAPKRCNDLPSDIRMAKSVDTFKKLLKTHFFLVRLFILS